MEEEVTKHTKKIYHVMKGSQSFWQKVKEVSVEIFIIVFAVTLSIWLHGWSDHHHEQKEASDFLKGLRGDLTSDIRLMEENRDSAIRVVANFRALLALDDHQVIDTTGAGAISHRLDFMMNATHANIGRYEGFKSSGKMGTIEDDSLKQAILVYYQQTIPNLDDLENLVNSFQTKIMDVELDGGDKQPVKGFLKSFKIRVLLQLASENLDGEIAAYTAAEQQATRIISMIDRQSQ